jgi:hypothetical protein
MNGSVVTIRSGLMDEQLRFNARMIMLGALAEPEFAGRSRLRHEANDAHVIAASRSPRTRRPTRTKHKPGVDDHEGSLGVVDVEALSGLWLITMKQGRQPRRTFHGLVAVLRSLEAELISDRPEPGHRWAHMPHDPSLDELGVLTARHTPGSGLGKVRIAADTFDESRLSPGEALAAWVGAYLRTRHDLVLVQAKDDQIDHDVFVWVTFGGAPWVIESFLADLALEASRLPFLPAPDLPEPISRVWVAAEYSDTGCRWDGQSWQSFQVLP